MFPIFFLFFMVNNELNLLNTNANRKANQKYVVSFGLVWFAFSFAFVWFEKY